MEFELTTEQQDIQKAVRDFAKGEFDKDLALELEEKHEFPKKIWKKAGKLGLIGVHFPEEYSGQGLGSLEDILVIEELCRGDSTIGSAVALSSFASELIMHYGNDEMKSRFPAQGGRGENALCRGLYGTGSRIRHHLHEHHRGQRGRRSG